jgi:hypothetical protein
MADEWNDLGSTSWGSTTTISIPTVIYSSPPTPSGTSMSVAAKPSAKGEISPKLYISSVKSKLNKLQKEKLKRRMQKLQKLIHSAKDLNQTGYYEQLSELMVQTVRESEALALGCTQWCHREAIEKFKNRVKDKVIRLEPLEKFPREIPANIRRIIKTHQTAKVFDELVILFIDYTGEELKTHKEKVKEKVAREKDPILFGKISFLPDRFYYIADWVDEYCDLTLDKFVDKIREEDPTYNLTETPELDENWLESLKAEVKKRHEELKPKNSWERGRTIPPELKEDVKPPEVKKPWWKLW